MHRSALIDKFSSRDEKSSPGADNICFILKVAKESSSWANIVPVQYFRERLLRGVRKARIKACQISPVPFTSQISKDHFATRDDERPA